MRLGLQLGYWGMGNDADNLALAKEADRLGYSVAWVAEAYGSDAPTILSWVAAQTERIDIGSAVLQIPARTPAMTAMTSSPPPSIRRSERSVASPSRRRTPWSEGRGLREGSRPAGAGPARTRAHVGKT